MSIIAFLGTGTMGLPIARNLAEAGFTVRAWNRSSDRAEPLTEYGATVCRSPKDAADGATVLITMLSDAAAVLDCAADAVGALEPDAIWLQMSTIGIEGITLCRDLAERANVTLVDAPVLGTREPAQKRELVVLASGPGEALDSCDRIFRAISNRTIRFGEVGDGTRGKLVVNNWILGITAVLGESISLARSLGVDPDAFLDAIADTSVDSPYAHIKGREMIDGDFSDPSFKLDLARKDASLTLAAAESRDVPVPVLRAVTDRLEHASRAGHGNEDMAALQLR